MKTAGRGIPTGWAFFRRLAAGTAVLTLFTAVEALSAAEEAADTKEGVVEVRPAAEDEWDMLRRRAATARMKPFWVDFKTQGYERFYFVGTTRTLPDRKPPESQKIEGGGNPHYDGQPAALQLLDFAVSVPLAHVNGNAPAALEKTGFPATLTYEVAEPGAFLISGDWGMGNWPAHNVDTGAHMSLYSSEMLDLSKTGRQKAEIPFFAVFQPRKGLTAIERRAYATCYEPKKKEFIGYAFPHAHWFTAWGLGERQGQAAAPSARFVTLANLSRFKLSLQNPRSTWDAGREFRIDFTVEDADGDVYPIVGARILGETDTGVVDFVSAVWPDSGLPKGYYTATLPDKAAATRITIQAECELVAPDGRRTKEQTIARFSRSDRTNTNDEMAREGVRAADRTPEGRMRQTRILTVGSRTIWPEGEGKDSAGSVQRALAQARRGRFNTLMAQVPLSIVLQHYENRDDADFRHAGITELSEQARQAGIDLWFWVDVQEQPIPVSLLRGVGCRHDASSRIPDSGSPCLRDTVYLDRIAEGCRRIAQRYKCAGFALEGLRWKALCVCDAYCAPGYKKQSGRELNSDYSAGPPYPESLLKWQEEGITLFLRDWSRRMRESAPNVKLGVFQLPSASPSLRPCNLQGQDPAGWFKQGLIDAAFPVVFFLDPLPAAMAVRDFRSAVGAQAGVYPLLMTAMISSRDYPPMPYAPLESVMAQTAQLLRDGCPGIGYYAEYVSPAMEEYLRTGPFIEDAIPFAGK
ncbi:MAG TPA: hypothetical protein PL033_19485 [Candidatus Brocadiia bacterium]|nr:hypothetical protein [Candidatus Brocadiia bacterium]